LSFSDLIPILKFQFIAVLVHETFLVDQVVWMLVS